MVKFSRPLFIACLNERRKDLDRGYIEEILNCLGIPEYDKMIDKFWDRKNFGASIHSSVFSANPPKIPKENIEKLGFRIIGIKNLKKLTIKEIL